MRNRFCSYFIVAAVAAFAVSAFCAAVDAVNFTRVRKRIVGRELIDDGARVVYTYQQGAKTWSETNAVRRIASRPVIRYSKLKLIVAAKSAGKWADVKAFIQANDMMDEWNACQYITSDYPAYITATNAVVSMGVATDAEVKAFMKAAED
jgi:hypothetical protein